jgi:phosphotransferase system HPr (HPr) family protein
MVTSQHEVMWRDGLHLRMAAMLVKLARRFQSAVRLRAGEQVANAENIMQLLLLSASLGTVLTIEAEGTDEGEAIEALQQFFNNADLNPDEVLAE